MNQAAQRHAARMRCQNTSGLLKARLRFIENQVKAGFLTEREAVQLKREFWEERARDKQLAK